MEKRQGLNLQDVMLILDIINLASTRNAFRVEEYSTVGAIFQKLSSLIQQASESKTDASSLSEETKND